METTTTTTTRIEFTQEFEQPLSGICYKNDDKLGQELNAMIDNFTNLLNMEIKEHARTRRTDTHSVLEVIGMLQLEYKDTTRAARKRDDMKYRKELFDLLIKGGLGYVDMQKKFLRLSA
jgi:hypothetical protein